MRKTMATVAVAAMAAGGLVVIAPAASAHSVYTTKSRDGCTWYLHSSNRVAGTRKIQGSCTGWSYVYIKSTTGWSSGWKSGRTSAGAYVPVGQGRILYSYHKTQQYEGLTEISHYH